jgi:hypothetical protein
MRSGLAIAIALRSKITLSLRNGYLINNTFFRQLQDRDCWNKWSRPNIIQLNSIGPQLMLEVIKPRREFKWRDLNLKRELEESPYWPVEIVGGLPHGRTRAPAGPGRVEAVGVAVARPIEFLSNRLNGWELNMIHCGRDCYSGNGREAPPPAL